MSEIEWIDVFGDNLVSILEDTKMTQRDLADEMGVAEATISNYVHKKVMPSIKTIVNMAYALGVDTDELIDFGDRIV